MQTTKISIAIHGGAGVVQYFQDDYKNGLKIALHKGYEILQKGLSAVQAVQSAVIELQNNPLFNAGKGSIFNCKGSHELQASLMQGSQLKIGSVSCLKNIKNPINLAKLVMQKSKHVMLSGQGAQLFAKQMNCQFVDSSYYFSQKRYQQWTKIKDSQQFILDHSKQKEHGTVGAVAIDLKGNLASATSTGGMTNKKIGRIGDSPIIGAGTYANNQTCAISCTGTGQIFIKTLAAHCVSSLMQFGNLNLNQACDLVVKQRIVRYGGSGGLIGIDKNGNYYLGYNSQGMYRGYKNSHGIQIIGI